MADVKIGMILSDNGSIKKKTDETKELNKELKTSTKLAQSALQPQTAAGRAVMSEAAGVGEYGRARGAAGATGAAARDFANQAQGLGGLVRLYATYAANIFAASAAFQALREAANTTNMIEGMNQLGAASGQALGNLSKRFMEATDGAISLREAMEATVKATSSGLSSEQVLQIAEVAKKASQALGVNMTDAVNRLTRGITKLEPELLDELAIFTKIGPATEAYARSVGKTASTLTDFERRQAFANAALKEGAEKFGEIQLQANPYDKLLAQLKNVALDALTAINKVLIPVIDLLSSSPTALALAIAFLAKTIISQALPAVSQWRASLASAAKNAAEVASELTYSRSEAATFIWEKRLNIPGLQAAVDTAKKELATLGTAAAPSTIGPATSRMLSSIRSKTSFDDKDVSKVTRAIEYQQKIVGRLAESQKDVDIARVSSARNNIAYLEAERAAMLKLIAAQKSLQAGYDAVSQKIDAPSATRREKMQDVEVRQAQSKAARLSALSELSSSVATIGVIEGIKKLDEDLATNKAITKFERVKTVGVGSIMAIGQAAAAAGRYVMSFVAGPLAAILLVIGILDLAFNKNSAAIDKFNKALEDGKASSESAAATIKKYSDSLGVERANAFNNALQETALSIKEASKAAAEAVEKQNLYTQFLDVLKRPFGADLRSKMAEAIVVQVEDAKRTIRDPKLKKEFEEDIKSLLGFSDLTEFDVKNVLNPKDLKEGSKLFSEIAGAVDKVREKSNLANIPLQVMKEGFKQLEKDYMDFSNSLVSSDPFTRLGMSLIQQSAAMTEAFKDPTNMAEALADILKDTSKIRMFPPEAQSIIISAAKDMETYRASVDQAQKDVVKFTSQLQGLNALKDSGDLTVQAEIRIAEENLRQASTSLESAAEKLQGVKSELTRATLISNRMGFEMMTNALVSAAAKSAIEVRKSIFAGAKETIGTVNLNAALDKQAIDVQINEIVTMQKLIDAIDLDRLSREKLALLEQQQKAKPGPTEEQAKIAENIRKVDAMIAAVTAKDPARALGNKKPSDFTIEDAAAAPILARKLGAQKQLTGLLGQQRMIDIQAAQKRSSVAFGDSSANLQSRLDMLNKQKEAEEASYEFSKKNAVQQAEILSKYEDQAFHLQEALEIVKAYKDVRSAQIMLEQAEATKNDKAISTATELVSIANADFEIAKAKVGLDRATLTANQDKRKKQAEEAAELKRINLDIQKRIDKEEELSEIYRNRVEIENSERDLQRANLDSLARKGHILSEVYAGQVRALELNAIEANRLAQLDEIRVARALSLLDLEKQLAEARKENDPDKVKYLENKVEEVKRMASAREAAINAVSDNAKKVRELQEDLGEHLKGYDDIFRNTFSNMADAIVEFVKTGKLSFKDLITDMISEILRLELRMQAMEMWKGIRGGTDGSGVLGWIGKALGASMGGGSFGGTFNVPGVPGMPDFLGIPVPDLASAKGTAFDLTATNGIVEFANGGAFTNSIVSSPTLFKFAQGTGLMGEAGPEAIMPLKRDENGTLGVRANVAQTKVDVVVNNYSGAQATAQETVDSRGNRRIEVTVSEMVAGEMIRPGSSTNQALRSATGGRPYVVRR